MVFVIGIINYIPDLRRYVFFGEQDNVSEYDAREEASFLSNVGGITIDLLESSKLNYHLVSYDILSLEDLLFIERLTSDQWHYFNTDELFLHRSTGRYLCKTLRLGDKFRKPSPRFVDRFENGHKIKSRGHYDLYRFFCQIPELKGRFHNTDKRKVAVVYKTGVNAHVRQFRNQLDRKVSMTLRRFGDRR